MNKTLVLPFLAFLFSCISPDEHSISADTEATKLDQVLMSAVKMQEGVLLHKRVEMDGTKESQERPFDTLTLKKDLKGLTEYSFARLIRPSNYTKTEVEGDILYERKAKEKKGPVSILISKNNQGQISALEVRFEDENYLYKSSQLLQLKFKNENLARYKIVGTRKLIGLAPSDYLIEVSVEGV